MNHQQSIEAHAWSEREIASRKQYQAVMGLVRPVQSCSQASIPPQFTRWRKAGARLEPSAVYISGNSGGGSGALAADMIRLHSSTKRTARCTYIWARLIRNSLSCPSFSPHPADSGTRCFPCIFSLSPVHPLHFPSRIHSVGLPGVMV